MATACRFEIEALADAQTLPRLVDHFARLGLTPTFVRAEVSGSTMWIEIEQPDLDGKRSLSIAEQMRASILVEQVVVQNTAPPLGGCARFRY